MDNLETVNGMLMPALPCKTAPLLLPRGRERSLLQPEGSLPCAFLYQQHRYQINACQRTPCTISSFRVQKMAIESFPMLEPNAGMPMYAQN